MDYETTFRNWAKANRLRLSTDEQGFPIVVRRGKKFTLDHLYEGFNDGIGLHITRDGKAKLSNIVTKLAGLGIRAKNRGDFEANFFVPWDKALEVARMFKFVKGKWSGKGFKPRVNSDSLA